MVKFLSLEHFKAAQEIANADEEFQIKIRGFDGTVLFTVDDKEDIKPVIIKFSEGKISEVKYHEDEKADYNISGPYNIWVQVNKKEIDGANAIMTRQLQFKGNTSTAMRYGKGFRRLFDLIAEIPVEY
jgi:putative sterol carrier protein